MTGRESPSMVRCENEKSSAVRFQKAVERQAREQSEECRLQAQASRLASGNGASQVSGLLLWKARDAVPAEDAEGCANSREEAGAPLHPDNGLDRAEI